MPRTIFITILSVRYLQALKLLHSYPEETFESKTFNPLQFFLDKLFREYRQIIISG